MIDITKLPLVGKGSFTKCYRLSEEKVLLKSSDPIKECMALDFFPECSLFPKVEFYKDDDSFYEMDYYSKVKSLKNNLDADQYQIYKDLREMFLTNCGGYYQKGITGYSKWYNVFESYHREDVAQLLLEALGACANFSSDIAFEISPRNVTAKNGKLVLLDCFFIVSELEKVTKK